MVKLGLIVFGIAVFVSLTVVGYNNHKSHTLIQQTRIQSACINPESVACALAVKR
jgi:Na+/melibiose symporter-like transporter